MHSSLTQILLLKRGREVSLPLFLKENEISFSKQILSITEENILFLSFINDWIYQSQEDSFYREY